jgi:murein DD-endopeptidase MepM/ murein hydrolase activator NlpD
LPFSLGSTIGGLPSFFIESFQVPPFLLPIFQAAGTAYNIPWQVLAAINEVETDYGRDLSISSAGAEGWMQFLPETWSQYGVDANGAGYEDPYNPADAIFAAGRYLRAAGGQKNIRAAIYSYNHSQAYVDSVMLRAQLLGGTPPELLGAITGLTESQFPVHAPSRFSDGFQTIPQAGSTPAKTLAGTTIYSQVGAPVIAVQDGEVTQVGDSPSLGRFVALRDAYGNTYIYAELGSLSSLYPVLEPRQHTSVSSRIDRTSALREAAPSGPATAGAQPRSPLSASAAVSSLALGAAAGLEPAPMSPAAPATPAKPAAPAPPTPSGSREFRSGPDDVYLHPLRAGVQVLAGTVLGHVGAGTTAGPTSAAPATGGPVEPHIFFQIKPAGTGAPLIDPKPILDGWVALEDTSIFRAKGENPFLATSPTVGQVLLESKSQLEQQIAHDRSIHMRACERQGAQTGRVGRPVLAMLEYLSVSGLAPTVTGLRCAGKAPASEGNAAAGASDSVEIVALDGVPIAGHQGPGSIADTLIRKLAMLEGLNRPRRIVSQTAVPGAANVYVRPDAGAGVRVSFAPPAGGAHAATASASGLTPSEWVKLIARLGEIPDPTVAGAPSSAAIPDGAGAAATGTGSGGPGSGGFGSGGSPSGEGSSGGNG